MRQIGEQIVSDADLHDSKTFNIRVADQGLSFSINYYWDRSWDEISPWNHLKVLQPHQIYDENNVPIQNAFVFKLDKWSLLEVNAYGDLANEHWKELEWGPRESSYSTDTREMTGSIGKVRYRTLGRERYSIYDYSITARHFIKKHDRRKISEWISQSKHMLFARSRLSDVLNRFENMTSSNIYRAVHQSVIDLAEGTLDLGDISRSIQAISTGLSPVRAAVALDMVAHMRPEELKKFLFATKFGRKGFESVGREMLILNYLLQERVESNNELIAILKVQNYPSTDQAIKNFRLFIQGVVGATSVIIARKLHRRKDELGHTSLSVETVKYLASLRNDFKNLPANEIPNTFQNTCPITLDNITREKGLMAISYESSNERSRTIVYYRDQDTYDEATNKGQFCPVTRQTHLESIPLSNLTDYQLLSILSSDSKLQEGALNSTKACNFAREFFESRVQHLRLGII